MVPMFGLMFLSIILIEAAGAASDSLQYPALGGTHQAQVRNRLEVLKLKSGVYLYRLWVYSQADSPDLRESLSLLGRV